MEYPRAHFTNNAGAFVLSGSELTIGAGGITNISANGQIINNSITLATNQTWYATSNTFTFNGNINNVTHLLTITGSSNSYINGVISGTNGLTKTGAGTLTLTASDFYGGLTTVSAGVLKIQHGSALGTTTTGTTVSSGAALQLQGDIAVDGETLTLNGSGILGSGALRSLSGSNWWSGAITLACSSTIGADAGTLDLEANIANATLTTTFTNAGTILLNGGLVGGTGKLVKNGPGLLLLGGSNTYSGTTTFNDGTVRCGAAGTLSSASAVTVNTNAILDLNDFSQTIASLAGAGG